MNPNENIIDHKYFTRSKVKQIKNKDTIEKKTAVAKKRRKIENYNKDYDEKLNMLELKDNSDGKIVNLFTELIEKIMDKIDDEDLDYNYIEGLPEDIIYSKEEKEYINKLDLVKRESIINLEKKLYKEAESDIPYRFIILNSSLKNSVKNNIIKKLDHFYSLSETDNEYHKLSQWVENLVKIPFNNYTKPIVKISDTPFDIVNYLYSVKNNLNKAVYGHDNAKNIIIQEIAKQITNPETYGNCIAIQGPPGNGKTTLIKEGVCKAVNRPFAFIALGGLQNSEFLTGHEYTYEGSQNGRIIEILKETGCMDPIIYFDELDKLSESPKGDEISNLLCHLTDTSQNNSFYDKYFSGIEFDLSRVSFIFSYNDESKINPILLDRMIKIKTDGFKSKDKITICNDYLIPNICKNIGFNREDVIFNNDIIQTLINSYTNNEKGVRNLKRCIESIIEKLNVLKLIYGYKSTKNIESDIIDIDIKNIIPYNIKNFSLPIIITDNIIKEFIKLETDTIPFGLYM
jgi:ATP-dependent Lon protease